MSGGGVGDPEAAAIAHSLAEQVTTLDEHIVASTVEVAMLRHEVAEERQARRSLAIVVGVVAMGVVFAALLSLGVSVIVFQNRSNARHTNDAVTRLAQVQRTLVECTTPGNPLSPVPDDRVHECYDEGQKQRAESVQQVIVGIVQGLRNAGAGIPNTQTP